MATNVAQLKYTTFYDITIFYFKIYDLQDTFKNNRIHRKTKNTKYT